MKIKIVTRPSARLISRKKCVLKCQKIVEKIYSDQLLALNYSSRMARIHTRITPEDIEGFTLDLHRMALEILEIYRILNPKGFNMHNSIQHYKNMQSE